MTRPRLVETSNQLVTGLVAVALFAVFAGVFLTAQLGSPAGFPEDGSITASIGYLMFNLGDQAAHGGEEFLVAFEIIDAVLVAALVGAVMLARREEGSVTEVLADGGRELGKAVRGRETGDEHDDADEGGADP